MKWAHNRTGFTIVELLIVIVVIAILAAITIVAYNGIQERSRAAAMAAELKQAATHLASWKVLHAEALPTNLEDIPEMANSADEFEYWTFNNNSQYCLSTTESNGSAYHIRSDTNSAPQAGSCTAIDWVAGEPLAYVDTPGQTVNFDAPLTGTPDITLYTIFSIVDAEFYYSGFAAMAPMTDGNRFYFQGSTTGSPTAGYRIDTPAVTNSTGAQANVRVAGYHVGWLQASNNATVRSFAFDKAVAHGSTTLSPGAGWTFTGTQLFPVTTPSYTPIAAVSYNAAHDQQTRAAVMNWLAKKYNTGLSF